MIDPTKDEVYSHRTHTYRYTDGEWRMTRRNGETVEVTRFVRELITEGRVVVYHFGGGTSLKRKQKEGVLT